MTKRAQSRSAARLAAVQALYQHEMEGTPVAPLIHEFHQHRIGAIIEDAEYADADVPFFDDIVKGALARADEIDAAISARLASGWTMERLDRTMKAILRAGAYELNARGDVRSEERRVGKECGRPGRSRWSPIILKKKTQTKQS